MKSLTREQVRKIDKLAVEKYGIPGVVLMENAARGVADTAADMLGGKRDGMIMILCGGGNNGGDGFAAARHLHNHGYNVDVLLTTDPDKFVGEALANWQIVKAMNLRRGRGDPSYVKRQLPALIIDAMFGTGLTQPPRPPFGDVLAAMYDAKAPILAVDVPSGLDCDTGKPLGETCVKAARTITFVAEKIGFAAPTAKEYTGKITIADIGCPRELIEEVSRS